MSNTFKVKSKFLNSLNETLQQMIVKNEITVLKSPIMEADGNFTSIVQSSKDLESQEQTDVSVEKENIAKKEELTKAAIEKIKDTLSISDELQSILNKIKKLNDETGINEWKINEEDNTATLAGKNARIFKQNENLCLSYNNKIHIFKSVSELHDWLKENNLPLPKNISLHESLMEDDENSETKDDENSETTTVEPKPITSDLKPTKLSPAWVEILGTKNLDLEKLKQEYQVIENQKAKSAKDNKKTQTTEESLEEEFLLDEYTSEEGNALTGKYGSALKGFYNLVNAKPATLAKVLAKKAGLKVDRGNILVQPDTLGSELLSKLYEQPSEEARKNFERDLNSTVYQNAATGKGEIPQITTAILKNKEEKNPAILKALSTIILDNLPKPLPQRAEELETVLANLGLISPAQYDPRSGKSQNRFPKNLTASDIWDIEKDENGTYTFKNPEATLRAMEKHTLGNTIHTALNSKYLANLKEKLMTASQKLEANGNQEGAEFLERFSNKIDIKKFVDFRNNILPQINAELKNSKNEELKTQLSKIFAVCKATFDFQKAITDYSDKEQFKNFIDGPKNTNSRFSALRLQRPESPELIAAKQIIAKYKTDFEGLLPTRLEDMNHDQAITLRNFNSKLNNIYQNVSEGFIEYMHDEFDNIVKDKLGENLSFDDVVKRFQNVINSTNAKASYLRKKENDNGEGDYNWEPKRRGRPSLPKEQFPYLDKLINPNTIRAAMGDNKLSKETYKDYEYYLQAVVNPETAPEDREQIINALQDAKAEYKSENPNGVDDFAVKAAVSDFVRSNKQYKEYLKNDTIKDDEAIQTLLKNLLESKKGFSERARTICEALLPRVETEEENVLADLENAEATLAASNPNKYRKVLNKYLAPYGKQKEDLTGNADFINTVGLEGAKAAVSELYDHEHMLHEDETPADFADISNAPETPDLDIQADTTSTETDTDTSDLNLDDLDNSDTSDTTANFGDLNLDLGGFSGDYGPEDEEEPGQGMPVPTEEYKISDVLIDEEDSSNIKVELENIKTGEKTIKLLSEIDV